MTVAPNLGQRDNDHARGTPAEMVLGQFGIQAKIAAMVKTRRQTSTETFSRARIPQIDIPGALLMKRAREHRAAGMRRAVIRSGTVAVQGGMQVRQVDMVRTRERAAGLSRGGPMMNGYSALNTVVPAVRVVIVVWVDSESNTSTVLANVKMPKVVVEIVEDHAQLSQLHCRQVYHR